MLKDPVEMTEDEIRMARDFEKKETAFLEEREKLKMALEAELRKLQSSITQSMEQFDERLYKLFHLKIKTEMSVQQVGSTSVAGGRLDWRINGGCHFAELYKPSLYYATQLGQWLE